MSSGAGKRKVSGGSAKRKNKKNSTVKDLTSKWARKVNKVAAENAQKKQRLRRSANSIPDKAASANRGANLAFRTANNALASMGFGRSTQLSQFATHLADEVLHARPATRRFIRNTYKQEFAAVPKGGNAFIEALRPTYNRLEAHVKKRDKRYKRMTGRDITNYMGR